MDDLTIILARIVYKVDLTSVQESDETSAGEGRPRRLKSSTNHARLSGFLSFTSMFLVGSGVPPFHISFCTWNQFCMTKKLTHCAEGGKNLF